VRLRIGIAALAIAFTGPAMASAQDDDQTDVYSVDLETGATTLVTSIEGVSADGMALSDDDAVYVLSDDDTLVTVTLDPEATPEAESPLTPDDTIEITGLADDEDLIGLDVRPATGDLYAISEGGPLYVFDVDTGEATAPGEAIDPALEDDSVGFDFNPTVDRIRVDVSTGQNLRLNPDTGAIGTNPETMEPTIDGTIAYAEGDDNADNTPAVVRAGYTNSVAGAEET